MEKIMKDMNDFAKINEIYFSDHKPARATVAVSNLPKGAFVEIDAIAIREKSDTLKKAEKR